MTSQEAVNYIKQQILVDKSSINEIHEALYIIQELAYKSTPRKPVPEGQDDMDYILCPTCYNPIGMVNDIYGDNSLHKFCHKCGQSLNWRK